MVRSERRKRHAEKVRLCRNLLVGEMEKLARGRNPVPWYEVLEGVKKYAAYLAKKHGTDAHIVREARAELVKQIKEMRREVNNGSRETEKVR